MPDRRVGVKLTADASDLKAEVRKAAAEVRALPDDKVVQLKADASQFRSALERTKRDADGSGREAGATFGNAFEREFRQRKVFFASVVAGALSAGAPLLLSSAAVMFGAVAGIAGAQAQEVRDAWTKLGRDIKEGTLEDARVMIPELTQMSEDLGASFYRLRPQIREAFEATAPLVETFTAGITGLAENAMPGFVRAVQAGEPVMDGFQLFMERVGTGFTDMFDAMTDHAPAAGAAFGDIGDILGKLLPILGEILGEGAELAQMVLPSVSGALQVVLSILKAIGPVLPAVVTGFIAMKVASGAAAGVKSLADSLGILAVRGEAAAKGTSTAAVAMSSAGKMGVLAAAGLVAFNAETSTNEDRVQRWAKILAEGGDEADDLRKKIQGAKNEHLSFGETLKNAFTLSDLWDDNSSKQMLQDFDAAQQAANDLSVATGGAVDSMGALTDATSKEARALVDLPGTLSSAAGGIALVGSTAGMTEDQMKTAAQTVVDFREEIQKVATDFVDPLNTYQTLLEAKSSAERKAAEETAKNTVSSSDSWVDYAAKTKVTLDEVAAKLQEQITNQQNWRTNLVTIAQWAGADVAGYLAKMGKDGVDIVAQMATDTSGQAQHMAELIRQDIQLGSAQWASDLQLGMKVMEEKGREGATATAQSIASALGVGVADVARVAGAYGITLASGMNPIMTQLGKPPLTVPQTQTNWGNNSFLPPGFLPNKWEGGYTGDGGKYQPMGIVHGGEYVFTKEETSRIGVDRLAAIAKNGYAGGGFVTDADVPKPTSVAPYSGAVGQPGSAVMDREYQVAVDWMKANAFVGEPAGAGVQRWLPMVISSLNMIGQPTSLAQTVLRRMNQESGGNPTAVNRTDINWQRGTPSVGLMQVIGPTYRAYKDPRRDIGPYLYGTSTDGLSNVLASERYALARYGSLAAAYNRAGGYAYGGMTPASDPFWVGENGPELMWSSRSAYVTSRQKSREYAGGGGAGPTTVVLANATVSGQFVMDPSGIVRLVDGRIQADKASSGRNARSWT